MLKTALAITAIGISVTVLLVSCTKEPLSTARTNNSEFEVAHLFDLESCHVYRFSDDGRHHYVTICSNGDATTNSTVGCGKNCTRPDDIQSTQSN